MLISDFPFVRTRHCQLSNGDARIFVFSRNTRPRLFPFCVVKIILAPPAKPLWALILAVPTQPSPEAVTSSPPPAVGSLRRRPLQTAPSAPHSCTSSSSCSSSSARGWFSPPWPAPTPAASPPPPTAPPGKG